MQKQGKRIHVDGNVISVPPKEFPFKRGIGTVLFNKMREGGVRNAQIDAVTGHVDTYEAFLTRCIRTAIVMRKKGIKETDIVTVCSSTHLDTSVPIIASFFLGAKPSNTDPRLTVADTIHLLKLVNPKMIFVSLDSVKLIENAITAMGNRPEIVVFGDTTQHTPFADFLTESGKEEALFKPVNITDLKETAVVYFSSGSTGLPKGICLSHLSLLACAIDADSLDQVSEALIFTLSPAYWTTFTTTMMIVIVSKSCRLLAPSFDASNLWETVARHKVRILFLSPTQVATLLQAPPPLNFDLSNLSHLFFGGSTISMEQMLKIRAYLPDTVVLCVYGLSELATAGLGFDLNNTRDLELAKQTPTCCGRPVAGFAYKIVDVETEQTLGPNEQGELRIKTEYQMNSYYKMDSSNEWDSDGFLRTQDVAYYDEDYCFYVIDRIREIFKYQSWQISPSKIESILLSHPAIESVVVIGLPHPIDMEQPAALVVLHSDYVGKVAESDIETFIVGKINPTHYLRAGVKFVKELHMTPSGKFKRRLMRELLLAGKL